MSLSLMDGKGSGRRVEVTEDFKLSTEALSEHIQHYHSHHKSSAYQVIGDFASLNNNTHTILHLKNTSTTQDMVVTYIRMQAITGGVTPPLTTDYFQVGFGTTYSTGGTAVTPVNSNRKSGNTAAVTAYDNNATVTGTFTEYDRWYIESTGKMIVFNKDGSLIIGPNDTLEVRIVTTATSGTAYARVTFIMMDSPV